MQAPPLEKAVVRLRTQLDAAPGLPPPPALLQLLANLAAAGRPMRLLVEHGAYRATLCVRLKDRVPAQPPARHSPDFRSVHWHGVDYVFSPIQAAIVRQLWQAWEQGTPDIGGDALMVGAGAETRELRHGFRNHPAWGRMIVSLRRGLYRLSAPPDA
jgi:hypothetical protein